MYYVKITLIAESTDVKPVRYRSGKNNIPFQS